MQSQYAAAANAPLIKSPALRVPRPVKLPPDIHPLPESVIPYASTILPFVYPFTLEPHVLRLESSRRNTIAAHTARREALLQAREDEKERRRREALRRVAPGFEGNGSVLMPVRVSSDSMDSAGNGAESMGGQVDAMTHLADQLARLDTTHQPAPRS
ncbi:hypothetical protein J3A83DRAFT_4091737 [Scleroderma citrinum]